MNHEPRWWGDLKLDQLHPASTTTQVSSDSTNVRYRYAAAHRPLSALHPPRAISMFTVTSRPFTRRSRAPIKRRRKSAPRDEARAWHPSRDGWQTLPASMLLHVATPVTLRLVRDASRGPVSILQHSQALGTAQCDTDNATVRLRAAMRRCTRRARCEGRAERARD
jgi:hypothetical protein